MADHADFGAEVAHDGGDRVGHNHGSAIGEFEHVRHRRPVAGLAAAVNGAGADVVVPSTHRHGGRDDVLTAFLRRIPVQDVFASCDDAGVPCVLTGG